MLRHHTLKEKKEIIRFHEAGASMVELMTRFYVRDHYLYFLFGRYNKYGIEGLEKLQENSCHFRVKGINYQ